jgi:hypothetical protein
MRGPRRVLLGLAGASSIALSLVAPATSAVASTTPAVTPFDVCHMTGSAPRYSNGTSTFTTTAVGSCGLTRVRAYMKCKITGSSTYVGRWVQGGAKSSTFCHSRATDWGYQSQAVSGGTIYTYSLKG